MEKLRTAVVGPGRIAVAHLAAIKNNSGIAELAAVVGLPSDRQRTRALAEQFNAHQASDEYEAVLRDPEIDAVVLTLPNHLHKSSAIAALEAGKHVLVEKPLCNTPEEADAMIAAAEKAGRVLMVAQCRRFFPAAQEAARRVAELGRPLDIVHVLGVFVDEAQAAWWKSADATGGLAIGLNGPHVVDTVLMLMGDTPVSVYAQSSRLKGDKWEGEDQATIVMRFSDGSTATGHLSFNMHPGVNERWIVGPSGMMHLRDDRVLTYDGDVISETPLTPYIDGDPSFDEQFRRFAECIRKKLPPQPSGNDGRNVVKILSAALRSASTGEPVCLSE
jgi:predicted dehydrogenase